MCNSPAAPSPQSSISDPFSWAIIHSPRPILRLIRWCSIRRVLWWPEQPSSAKSFHLTHPMWLWYMRMTYSWGDAQGGSGNAKSSKKNAQSTRLGELHIWGTPPLTRSFIMAENRQGAGPESRREQWLCALLFVHLRRPESHQKTPFPPSDPEKQHQSYFNVRSNWDKIYQVSFNFSVCWYLIIFKCGLQIRLTVVITFSISFDILTTFTFQLYHFQALCTLCHKYNIQDFISRLWQRNASVILGPVETCVHEVDCSTDFKIIYQ